MSHPAVTLKKSSDGIAYSAFPLGNKPAGALSYYNITNPGATPVHGDLVAICTDTYNFGTVGPQLIVRMSFKGRTVGDVNTLTDVFQTSSYMQSMVQSNPNPGVSDGKFKIVSDASLPYGVGLAVGRPTNADLTITNAVLKVTAKKESTKSFTHAVYHFPTANQDAALTAVQTSSDTGWGIKTIWDTHTAGNTSSNLDIDVYYAAFRVSGNQPSVIPSKEYLCNSNDTNLPAMTISITTSNTQSALNPSNTSRWRSAPIIQQHYIKIAESGKVEAKLIDTTTGVVYGFPTNSVSQKTNVANADNTFQNFFLNAQCNGFPIDIGANYILGELYKATGDGAECRVTISDVPGAGNTGSSQKLETVNDHDYWSPRVLIVKVVEGLFAGQSLAGKYFNVVIDENQYVASTAAIA